MRPGRRVSRILVLGLPLAVARVNAVYAVPPALVDAVPRDVVAAWFNAGPEEGGAAGAGSAFGVAAEVVDRATEVGLLSKVGLSVRAWMDGLLVTSVLLEHPHAVVLFDIRAAPRADGGHELASLHAAVIIHTGGPDAAIDRRIQHLLNTYTNSDESVLSQDTRAGRVTYTLADRRLPDWAKIQWGRRGDLYVAAIGDGCYRRVIDVLEKRSPSLSADAWFAEAFGQAGGASASAACYVRFDAARKGADNLLVKKIDRVQTVLHLDAAERGFWTLARAGRAFEANAFLRRSGEDDLVAIAGGRFFSEKVPRSTIPDQATGYVVLNGDSRGLFHMICEAYLASRSIAAQQKSQAFWGNVEKGAGVDIDRDIFSRLGRPLVIHDYPRHALQLPLAWTLVVPVDGDAEALRRHVDRLLEFAAKEYLKAGVTRLRHDPDGVWSISWGISGPALVVTDRWLIVSFSPYAVRQNMVHLIGRLLRPAQGPGSFSSSQAIWPARRRPGVHVPGPTGELTRCARGLPWPVSRPLRSRWPGSGRWPMPGCARHLPGTSARRPQCPPRSGR